MKKNEILSASDWHTCEGLYMCHINWDIYYISFESKGGEETSKSDVEVTKNSTSSFVAINHIGRVHSRAILGNLWLYLLRQYENRRARPWRVPVKPPLIHVFCSLSWGIRSALPSLLILTWLCHFGVSLPTRSRSYLCALEEGTSEYPQTYQKVLSEEKLTGPSSMVSHSCSLKRRTE